MNAAWIGVVGALLGGLLAGILSSVNMWMSGQQQLERDRDQRKHEIAERRFDAQRDAYVNFASACHQMISETDRYIGRNGSVPGDFGDEGPYKPVYDALNMVQIVGPEDLATAATTASSALHEWAYAVSGTTAEQAVAAVSAFHKVSRTKLNFD